MYTPWPKLIKVQIVIKAGKLIKLKLKLIYIINIRLIIWWWYHMLILLFLTLAVEEKSKIDRKKESTSSRRVVSKKCKSDNFLFCCKHTTRPLLGFLGVDGQLLIEGSLWSEEVGVTHFIGSCSSWSWSIINNCFNGCTSSRSASSSTSRPPGLIFDRLICCCSWDMWLLDMGIKKKKE